jgi:hypothetical protein
MSSPTVAVLQRLLANITTYHPINPFAPAAFEKRTMSIFLAHARPPGLNCQTNAFFSSSIKFILKFQFILNMLQE